jgi:subtilisin
MSDPTDAYAEGPVPTGNQLVLFKENTTPAQAIEALQQATGAMVTSSRMFNSSEGAAQAALETAPAILFEELGIAVVRSGTVAEARTLQATLSSAAEIEHVRPEYYMYAIDADMQSRYNDWVRQGLKMLTEGYQPPTSNRSTDFDLPSTSEEAAARFNDNVRATWGIQAVGADRSRLTGHGIRVAVLDTGLALRHPDFAGRRIVAKSFIPRVLSVEDGHGHGTHCIGTALGPNVGAGHPRHGIAYGADIYVGKVLTDAGSGQEGWILAGMEWAIRNHCAVISMSLGRSVRPGEAPDPLYERMGNAALQNGCLIVAAAGNESRRPQTIAPVGAPANALSIMAVGAIDNNLRIAPFSSGGINPHGGEVDICAPGVAVWSSVPAPRMHAFFNGTSMATPHVAGCAALLAQSNPRLRGRALWQALTRTALRISGLPPRDGGAGLVQAPRVTVPHADEVAAKKPVVETA